MIVLNFAQIQNLPAIICDLVTYKEKVDKLKLIEVANQFRFENEHRFSS